MLCFTQATAATIQITERRRKIGLNWFITNAYTGCNESIASAFDTIQSRTGSTRGSVYTHLYRCHVDVIRDINKGFWCNM